MRPIRTRLVAGAVCTGAALLLGPLAATSAYAAPTSTADDTPEDTQTPQAADGSGALANAPVFPSRPDEPVSTDPQQNQSPLPGTEVVARPLGELAAPLTSALEGTVDTTADKAPQQTATPEAAPAQDQPEAESPKTGEAGTDGAQGQAGDEGEQAPGSAGSEAEADDDSAEEAPERDRAAERDERAAEEAEQAEAEKANSEARGTPTGELGADPAGPTPAGGLPEAESSCSAGTLGCSDEDARSDSAAPRRSADSSARNGEPPALPRTGAATGLLPIGAALVVLGAFAAGNGRHRRPFGG